MKQKKKDILGLIIYFLIEVILPNNNNPKLSQTKQIVEVRVECVKDTYKKSKVKKDKRQQHKDKDNLFTSLLRLPFPSRCQQIKNLNAILQIIIT